MRGFALVAVFVFTLFFAGMAQAAEAMPPCEACNLTFVKGGSDYSQGQWGGFTTDGNAFASALGGKQMGDLWTTGSGTFDGTVIQGQGLNQNFDIPGGSGFQNSGSFVRIGLKTGGDPAGN